MAVLSRLSLTSFQLTINDLETSIPMGSGKLRERFYILIREIFPCHLAKSTPALYQVTDNSRTGRDHLHDTSGIIMIGRARWNMHA